MGLLLHEPSDWNSDGYRWTLIALDTSRLMSNTHVEDAPIMDVVRITIGLINGQTACPRCGLDLIIESDGKQCGRWCWKCPRDRGHERASVLRDSVYYRPVSK